MRGAKWSRREHDLPLHPHTPRPSSLTPARPKHDASHDKLSCRISFRLEPLHDCVGAYVEVLLPRKRDVLGEEGVESRVSVCVLVDGEVQTGTAKGRVGRRVDVGDVWQADRLGCFDSPEQGAERQSSIQNTGMRERLTLRSLESKSRRASCSSRRLPSIMSLPTAQREVVMRLHGYSPS